MDVDTPADYDRAMQEVINQLMRKRALAVAGVLTALLVLAALALVIGFDANRYRAQAQTLIASRLGRAVTLGQLHLSFIPFGIRVENVEIAEDPGVRTGRPFAHASEFTSTCVRCPCFAAGSKYGRLSCGSRRSSWCTRQMARGISPLWAEIVPSNPGSRRSCSTV